MFWRGTYAKSKKTGFFGRKLFFFFYSKHHNEKKESPLRLQVMNGYDRTMRFRTKFPSWTRYNALQAKNSRTPGVLGADCDTYAKFSGVLNELIDQEVVRRTIGGQAMTVTGFTWHLRDKARPVQRDNIRVDLQIEMDIIGGMAAARAGAAEYIALHTPQPPPEPDSDDDDDGGDDARSATSRGSAGSNASSLSTGGARLSLGGDGLLEGCTRLPLPPRARVPTPLNEHASCTVPPRETLGMSARDDDCAFLRLLYGTDATVPVAVSMRLPTLRDREARAAATATRMHEREEQWMADARARMRATMTPEQTLERGRQLIHLAWVLPEQRRRAALQAAPKQ